MAAMTERRIGLADVYGTVATVRIHEDGEASLELMVGQCGGRGYPTPEACRQLAAALLDAAEAAESEGSA